MWASSWRTVQSGQAGTVTSARSVLPTTSATRCRAAVHSAIGSMHQSYATAGPGARDWTPGRILEG
jgi:hypothetical protein